MQQEWEANDFAAELLMPMRLFAEDVRLRSPSFTTVRWLAGDSMYSVSITAAAWLLVLATREACALIVSTDGVVDWVARSDAFRLPLAERRQRLLPDTHAAGVFRGEETDNGLHPVPLGAWIDAKWPVRGVLHESTFAAPRFNQVFSLLWLAPDEEDEEAE